MKLFMILACSLFLNTATAFAQGPITYSAMQKAAQIGSDVSVGASLFFDSKSSWESKDRTKAFICQGARDGATYGLGWLGQKFITSPRPDGSGNGFPSIHTAFAASAFHSSNIWLDAGLAGLTGALRVLGDKHTTLQVVAGGVTGFGTSFIRCGQ